MKKLVSIILLTILVGTVFAQEMAFTYQGRLNSSGVPVNGLFDLRFRIAADPFGNTFVGNAFVTNGVGVNNGLFSTAISFDTTLFLGQNYWLEIDVRTNGAITFNPLSPLQPFTATPYAFFALNANQVIGSISSSQLTGAIPTSLLPTSILTNNASNVNLTGIFNGDGRGLTNSIPRGVITMWFGSINSVPTGWALCNGDNGTPDLRNRFIIGANTDYQGLPGTTIEGTATQVGGTVSHIHTGTTDPLNIGLNRIDDNSGGTDFDWMSPNNHVHTFTTNPAKHLPPYYALAYIMKL